uniref:Uncharacterized protein n=1 Tax=Arundo donax TaxID=35708 RepID=A0A0A9C3R9_ARUDO
MNNILAPAPLSIREPSKYKV